MEVLEEPVVQHHLLTVEQYRRMGEAGVFAPDARVELIEGELIQMASMGSRHFGVVARLNRLLTIALADKAQVNSQLPLQVGKMSEPEPDLSVLKPREDFYGAALPTESDALLVIEVSDSTLAFDLRTKARVYASHGIPAYWVFDLRQPALRVFTEPKDGGYAKSVTIASPGVIAVPGVEGVSVDLTGIW